MGLSVKQEVKTEVGYVDILLNDKIILEIAGNVHYLNDLLDLKISYKKRLAKLWGYNFIILRDVDF